MLWRLLHDMNPSYDTSNGAGRGSDKVPERSEIDARFHWNVGALFADDEEWNAGFAQIEEVVAPLEAMRGELNSPEAIAVLFEVETKLDRLLEKLYVYAHLRADEDTADSANQERNARIRARLAEVSGRLSWITPEILTHTEEELQEWTASDALRENRYAMVRLLRRKPHTLSDKEERLLSRAAEIFSAPQQVFGFLTNADMRFPDVTGSDNAKRELSQGRYITFLIERERNVRRDAFAKMYETYGSFKNTLAGTLSAAVKLNNYRAEMRNFGSALEASLHSDQIPVALYENMIRTTHGAFPYFYDYVDLRKRQLGIEDVDMCDMYVPIVPDYDMRVPFDEARELVFAACAPLGEEYVSVLSSAFEDGWIDVYENRGKRSGAYSSGCYDSLPYVLLNYQGTLDDVFTLAHELGHSMHSRLSNRTQPHRFARYPIFVAEIASTLNEALLLQHLLEKADTDAFRAYLLNHLCDSFKGTVYRQTMFAEFEKLIHELDATGQPLTPAVLNEKYYAMNAQYYGPAVSADRQIEGEWSRIPHFYYNFYVYKYATSFCASQVFSRRVLESDAGRRRYLDLLRSGWSDDPLAMIEKAGVDLLDPTTLEEAFGTFHETVGKLSALLE